MKKVLLFVVLAALLTVSAVFAQDLGVQLIGAETIEAESLSLDDIQINGSYKIDGYARVDVLSFGYYDAFSQYNKDNAGNNSTGSSWKDSNLVLNNGGLRLVNVHWNDSGTGADFAILRLDLTNLQKKDHSFMGDISIKVIYDDEYEFAGWVRQFNHDYENGIIPLNRKLYEGKIYANEIAIDPANEEPISQMYTGSYALGCTLPNSVAEGKEPLRMEITLGDNDLTYYIRK